MTVQSNPEIAVVWFKRDLRLRDHAPLKAAADTGLPLLLIYIVEPNMVADPHMQARHWRFIFESINELNEQLEDTPLTINVCNASAKEVFGAMFSRFPKMRLFSFQEVGLKHTYIRDQHVKALCSEHGVRWLEFEYGAVKRGLSHRRDWNTYWQSVMTQPLADPDLNKANCARPLVFREASMKVLLCNETIKRSLCASNIDDPSLFQQGGEKRAWFTLEHFYRERGKYYAQHISSPTLARKACSRLSPYLAWGNMSIRQVYQQVEKRRVPRGWKRSINAFTSRLHWHCHFIQKFESEADMEFRATNRAYAQYPYSNDKVSSNHLLAWKNGCTGVPLVDACMRAVCKTGYLNFRMRAMLVSFLTHHLNIDWRLGGEHLGAQFLDFEPGIHYPQFHMQAGITGTNTIRIYNPIKQSQEKDPEGVFIRKWCPELSEVPNEIIHTPWELTAMEESLYNVRLGQHYPNPIVNVDDAARAARERLWGFRARDDVSKEAMRVLNRLCVPNS